MEISGKNLNKGGQKPGYNFKNYLEWIKLSETEFMEHPTIYLNPLFNQNQLYEILKCCYSSMIHYVFAEKSL